jgi:hypothetical protein
MNPVVNPPSAAATRRCGFLVFLIILCITGSGLVAGGVVFVFVHVDSFSIATTLIMTGIGLFPVAYFFRTKSGEDALPNTTTTTTKSNSTAPNLAASGMITIGDDSSTSLTTPQPIAIKVPTVTPKVSKPSSTINSEEDVTASDK